MKDKIIACYTSYSRVLDHAQSAFLLAVRLYWGWQFVNTGKGKLNHITQTAEYFASLNIHFPTLSAYMVGGLELTGGVLLILGLFSRLISLPLTFNMLAAFYFADKEALTSIFSDPGKFYAADPYTFLFAAIIILVFGSGRYALDALLSSHNNAAKSVGDPALTVSVNSR